MAGKKQKTINKRAVLKNIDDILKKENEPYRSIILILLYAANFNQIFKTMKTMELRELIVKRYQISPKKRDKKRYPIFIKLKHELKKNIKILLDQDISPKKNLEDSTSSDYHRFEAYLKRLEKKGLITRPKRGYCKISNKYMFRPMQEWLSKIISNSNINNIAAYWNSMLFMPALKIDELEYNEIKDIRILLYKCSDNYYRINQLLSRIGIRKATIIWQDFKKNYKGTKIILFYYWLQLIINLYGYNNITAYYYIQKKNKKKEQEDKSDFELSIEIFEILRYESNQKKLNSEGIKKWQEEFKNLIDKSFFMYITRKYPDINKKSLIKTLNDEKNRYNKKFIKMINTIIQKWNSIESSIQISIPEFIRYQAIEKNNMNKKNAFELEQAVRYLYNNTPFLEKIVNKSVLEAKIIRQKIDKKKLKPEKIIYEIEKDIENYKEKKDINKKEELTPSFFEINDFLKGLNIDIKSLGYKNKKELYTEIRTISNNFRPPKLTKYHKDLKIN